MDHSSETSIVGINEKKNDLKSLMIKNKAHFHLYHHYLAWSDKLSAQNKQTFDYFNEEIQKMVETDENYALYKSCLAFCYYYGVGTAKDSKVAFELYEVAAKKGLNTTIC